MIEVKSEWVRQARSVSAPVDPPKEDMPAWIEGMAHNIAIEYTRENEFAKRERLERDIVNAMCESAREVALFFAANPKAASDTRAHLKERAA